MFDLLDYVFWLSKHGARRIDLLFDKLCLHPVTYIGLCPPQHHGSRNRQQRYDQHPCQLS